MALCCSFVESFFSPPHNTMPPSWCCILVGGGSRLSLTQHKQQLSSTRKIFSRFSTSMMFTPTPHFIVYCTVEKRRTAEGREEKEKKYNNRKKSRELSSELGVIRSLLCTWIQCCPRQKNFPQKSGSLSSRAESLEHWTTSSRENGEIKYPKKSSKVLCFSFV